METLAEHIPDAHTLPGRRPRADDDSATFAQHPLLAALGREFRELQGLSAGGATVADVLPSRDTADNSWTRLALLQADIRANRAPDPVRPLPADDLSVQAHSWHGPSRQFESCAKC